MGNIWLDPPLHGCGAPGTGASLESVFAPGVKQPPVCAARDTSDLTAGLLRLPLQPAAVGNVPHFLRYLSAQLHQRVPGGLVLWYDSVVSSGQLKWQDELNQLNR